MREIERQQKKTEENADKNFDMLVAGEWNNFYIYKIMFAMFYYFIVNFKNEYNIIY